MKKVILIGILGGLLAIGITRACEKPYNDTTNEPKKKINCMVCGKDLTDDYNRIAPNGHDAYYCTPCYQATMRQVHKDIQAEGYN